MSQAAVSVDGTGVGETDEDGRATVTVPDDGADAFEIEVARGEFAGTTTVDVLVLEATLVSDGLLPVPGSDGAVEATVGGEPVDGATVTVDGESDGTTGADGRLAIELPRDPTTTVTVTTERQTARTSVVGTYGVNALSIALVLTVLAALSFRIYGRRGPVAVVGVTAALLTVLVVEAVYGATAALAVLGIGLLLGLGVVVGRAGWSRPSRRDLPSIRDRLERLTSWLVGFTVGVVERLEAALEWGYSLAGAVREWLESLPRSGRALWARFTAWLRGLPTRTVAAGFGALVLVAGGYVVDGGRGAALVAVALAVAGVVVRRRDETETEAEPTTADEETADSTATETAPDHSGDERRSFRELWRAFARRVEPGRWRTRTPGEIERRALSKGYPRQPVRELTTLFREVEYGGRPRSSGRRERAADAYDAVERARIGDESTESDAEDRPESATEPASATEGEP
nr:DUF4129 domain-containing protein [Natrinema longum]